MNVTTTLGERIEDIRKRHKMTQTEFGEVFGVRYQQVSAWENDKRTPSTDILMKMAREYDCSLYWLVTGNDDENHVVCEELCLSNDTVILLRGRKDTVVKQVLHLLVSDWKVLHRIYDYLNSDFLNVCRKGTFDYIPVSELSDFDKDDLETIKSLRLMDDFKRIRNKVKGDKAK